MDCAHFCCTLNQDDIAEKEKKKERISRATTRSKKLRKNSTRLGTITQWNNNPPGMAVVERIIQSHGRSMMSDVCFK